MVQKHGLLVGGGWDLSSFSSQGLWVGRVTNTWYPVKGQCWGEGLEKATVFLVPNERVSDSRANLQPPNGENLPAPFLKRRRQCLDLLISDP